MRKICTNWALSFLLFFGAWISTVERVEGSSSITREALEKSMHGIPPLYMEVADGTVRPFYQVYHEVNGNLRLGGWVESKLFVVGERKRPPGSRSRWSRLFSKKKPDIFVLFSFQTEPYQIYTKDPAIPLQQRQSPVFQWTSNVSMPDVSRLLQIDQSLPAYEEESTYDLGKFHQPQSAPPSPTSVSPYVTIEEEEEEEEEERECQICITPLEEPKERKRQVILPCIHIFHEACIRPWFIEQQQTTCPSCRFWFSPAIINAVLQEAR